MEGKKTASGTEKEAALAELDRVEGNWQSLARIQLWRQTRKVMQSWIREKPDH
ncbi:MAG: hypothetical protein ACLVBP_02645 [Ruminococcus sp.]